MELTGTHINYFFVCKRKLWLWANGIYMEHESQAVEDGLFIHQTSYRRRTNDLMEITIGRVKVDYYDPVRGIVHEVKKSDKIEKAHIWQIKYYMAALWKRGLNVKYGVLEYPRLRLRKKISFNPDTDLDLIKKLENQVKQIITSSRPPKLKRKSYCRACSYYEFCFVNENQNT